MALEFEGKVAIVTGSSRGIGLACAERLLAEGAIVAGCSTDRDVKYPASDRYGHQTVDVANPSDLEDFVGSVAARHGRIDVLVNNAGSHPPTQAIDDFSVDDFDALYRLNLRSVFVASRAALPSLRKNGGAIVNMASAVGLYGQEGAVTYCATKAGIIGLTKALAIDEAPNDVRVNAVCPGAILTPLAKEVHPQERRDRIATWSWMGRWGTAEEVAELVLFLAGRRSAYITGQEMVIGGGTELGYGFKGAHYYHHMGIAPVAPGSNSA